MAKRGRSNDGSVSQLQGLCLLTLLDTLSTADLNKTYGLLNKIKKKRRTNTLYQSFETLCPSWQSIPNLMIKFHGGTGRLQYIEFIHDTKYTCIHKDYYQLVWGKKPRRQRSYRILMFEPPILNNIFMKYKGSKADTRQEAIERAKRHSKEILSEVQLGELYDFCTHNKDLI